MRGCKGRKLGCVNGCVRLDCIFFVSFLCVFFIFNLVFQTLATQKSFEVVRSFMFALFHGTDRHTVHALHFQLFNAPGSLCFGLARRVPD